MTTKYDDLQPITGLWLGVALLIALPVVGTWCTWAIVAWGG